MTLRDSAICLLAAVYHESCRPSVAAGDTLAHTVGQARPFTEFPQLSDEARRGRELTAENLLGRFGFSTGSSMMIQPWVDDLAQAIHECEREAVELGLVVVKLNPPRPWIPFADLPEPAQEGRRGQARYLLERFRITASAVN